jgi:hypothetical protein
MGPSLCVWKSPKLKAKQDLKDTEQMIENYKKPVFILGQRMVQRHSEVDQSSAVVVGSTDSSPQESRQHKCVDRKRS